MLVLTPRVHTHTHTHARTHTPCSHTHPRLCAQLRAVDASYASKADAFQQIAALRASTPPKLPGSRKNPQRFKWKRSGEAINGRHKLVHVYKEGHRPAFTRRHVVLAGGKEPQPQAGVVHKEVCSGLAVFLETTTHAGGAQHLSDSGNDPAPATELAEAHIWRCVSIVPWYPQSAIP